MHESSPVCQVEECIAFVNGAIANRNGVAHPSADAAITSWSAAKRRFTTELGHKVMTAIKAVHGRRHSNWSAANHLARLDHALRRTTAQKPGEPESAERLPLRLSLLSTQLAMLKSSEASATTHAALIASLTEKHDAAQRAARRKDRTAGTAASSAADSRAKRARTDSS